MTDPLRRLWLALLLLAMWGCTASVVAGAGGNASTGGQAAASRDAHTWREYAAGVSETSLFDPFPVLSTARLRLREMRSSDAVAYFVIRGDAAVGRFIRVGPDTELATTEARIERMREGVRAGTAVHWTLESRATGAYIGTASFWRWDQRNCRAELGYDLAPDHWGQGTMVEALTPIIAYGFETMKLHSMEANIDPENRQSARVLEKLGFVQEAHFRENVFKEGRFSDTAVYSLLRSAS